MAGLLNSAGAQQPQQMSQAQAPANDPTVLSEDGEQPNVTPEEQAQYEKFVSNGLEVIYGGEEDGARPDILNRLRESEDAVENLANTSAWLVTMLETSAEQGGTQLDDAVVMHGGRALMEELVEVCEAAQIHEFTEEQMEAAWYRGLDLYRETATQQGRIDPEALKEQFGEIERADQEGRMGEVLPHIDQAKMTNEG